MKTEIRPLRLLFLSYESCHDKIFLSIVYELTKICNIWFKILDSNRLFSKPLSIRFSCKKEIRHFVQILDQAKPDVFVVANDQGISATFIRICKLRGIPSVAIQDGIIANKRLKGFSRFLSRRRYLPWRIISKIANIPAIFQLSVFFGRQWWVEGWGTGDPTVVAVTGNYYKQVLISRGVHPNKIVVTGYPLLDDLSKHCSEHNAQSNFFKEVGLPNSRPLLLLITQPLVEDGLWEPAIRALYFDSVVNAVKHVDGQLVVKVHPREQLDVYELLANKHRDVNIVVTNDFDLDRLLLSSDLVITVYSTVGLWAIAYEKPLVVMNCFPLPVENVLADMALSVDELDKLPFTLNQILSDETQRTSLMAKELRSLHDHLYLLDGCASARLAKLILTLAKDGSKNYK